MQIAPIYFMQLPLRNKNLIFVSLLLVALLPYFIICFYAFPFADDFCFGWTTSEKIPFVQKFLTQYLNWNGRYTADVLVNFHPLITGKILVYQLSLFISLLATPIILTAFIQQLLKDKVIALTVSLFITLFYLNYLPNLTEGVYWYIGITNYHLGNLSLLLQLIFFIKSISSTGKTKIILQVSSLLLLIISIGFNEVGAVLIPLFYFCSIIFYPKYEPKKRKGLILHFLVAIAASAFVIFSPGNFEREALFTNNHNIIHSLLYSSLQTVRFIGKWSFSIPFFALSLVTVALAIRIETKFIRRMDYKIIFAFMIFTVFIGSFLPYFATGILGQHRTINYIFLYFILLWIMFLISVSAKYLLHQKFIRLQNEKVILCFLLISICSIALSGNSWKIISDYKQNNFRKHENEYYTRQSAILKNPELPIQPLKLIPKTFQIPDTKADTAYWIDKCMKNFYVETKVELK